MGVLSNKDLERKTLDREEPTQKKNIPSYQNEFKKFRQKYKSTSPRRPIEPKNWQDDKEVEELEH